MSDASRETWGNIGKVVLGGAMNVVQGEKQRNQSRQSMRNESKDAELANQREILTSQRAQALERIKNKGKMDVVTLQESGDTERAKIQYGDKGEESRYTDAQLVKSFSDAKKAYNSGVNDGDIEKGVMFEDFAKEYMQTSVYDALVASGDIADNSVVPAGGVRGGAGGAGGSFANSILGGRGTGGGKTLKKESANQGDDVDRLMTPSHGNITGGAGQGSVVGEYPQADPEIMKDNESVIMDSDRAMAQNGGQSPGTEQPGNVLPVSPANPSRETLPAGDTSNPPGAEFREKVQAKFKGEFRDTKAAKERRDSFVKAIKSWFSPTKKTKSVKMITEAKKAELTDKAIALAEASGWDDAELARVIALLENGSYNAVKEVLALLK